ncbi:MAG: ABC transporter permease [Mollicutes bacterium]|nr:ABC transporter permease [Mollicutes bacterium]
MQVYKVYLKILKRLYPFILMYVVIFYGIFLLQSMNEPTTNNLDFQIVKPSIPVINHDDSLLTNTFIDYLKEKTKIVDIAFVEEKISDALFHRQIYYVIEIPDDFGKSFINKQTKQLKISKIPASAVAIYVESLINKFFNTARLYLVSGIDEATLSESIIKDLSKEVKVEIKDKITNNTINAGYYYNFSNYVYLCLLILIISLITQVFNQTELKKRNLSSPVKLKKINFQLMLGHISVTIIVWLIFVIGSLILMKNVMFTFNGLLLIFNSLIFVIVAANIAFLIGNLAKNSEAQSAIANIVSIGSSFICGAFVPQMFLDKKVLLLARFLPSYWFIRANDVIVSTSKLGDTQFSIITKCIVMQIIFIFIIYFMNLVITKFRRKEVK